MVGYLIAIVTTVVVMIIFDHGQPALLYLVPGCILAVLFTSIVNNEFNDMWTFNEEDYYAKKEEEKKDK